MAFKSNEEVDQLLFFCLNPRVFLMKVFPLQDLANTALVHPLEHGVRVRTARRHQLRVLRIMVQAKRDAPLRLVQVPSVRLLPSRA